MELVTTDQTGSHPVVTSMSVVRKRGETKRWGQKYRLASTGRRIGGRVMVSGNTETAAEIEARACPAKGLDPYLGLHRRGGAI